MKANYLYERRTCKFRITTNSSHKYPIAPNILNQNFKVSKINQVWVSDITYIQTDQGWMYLTVIIDLFNRKVVGWSMSVIKLQKTLLLEFGIWLLEITI